MTANFRPEVIQASNLIFYGLENCGLEAITACIPPDLTQIETAYLICNVANRTAEQFQPAVDKLREFAPKQP